MTHTRREQALAKIRSNIERSGFHVYYVIEGTTPRFTYSIGLHPTAGAELILAGAAFHTSDETKRIIDDAARRPADALAAGATIEIDGVGSFVLRAAHQSWVKLLALGAVDYLDDDSIAMLQLVPDEEHWTVDVPDMSRPFDPAREPIWRWETESWPYEFPASSRAITNLNALRGALITEGCRWEDDEWECFAGPGPDVDEEDMRVVPIGVLLGADPSLERITRLSVGTGVWRDAEELIWNDWSRSG